MSWINSVESSKNVLLIFQMHKTILRGSSLPQLPRCTTCCDLYHCPFCQSSTFKPTYRCKVQSHVIRHIQRAVSHEGKVCIQHFVQVIGEIIVIWIEPIILLLHILCSLDAKLSVLGYIILRCGLKCKSQLHYHCVHCQRIVMRRGPFVKHLRLCKNRKPDVMARLTLAQVQHPWSS